MNTISASEWISLLMLGGMLGMIGQGVRAVAGLKKAHEEASQKDKVFGDVFELSRLLISLLIGFIAGALAVLGLANTQGE